MHKRLHSSLDYLTPVEFVSQWRLDQIVSTTIPKGDGFCPDFWGHYSLLLNTNGERMQDCLICSKHRGETVVPGGAVYEDELVYAGHSAIAEGESETYLGIFFIEPKRHLPGLAELTEEEAQRAGLLVTRLSRALKVTEGAEHIYLFVMGHHVPHLHIWVVPRYPGTPREFWGFQVDEWPGAPAGDGQEIEALCDRLRAHLAAI